jgi:hypothetical protein
MPPGDRWPGVRPPGNEFVPATEQTQDVRAAGLTLIEPEWPAPDNVRACQTTRLGGVSKPPFDSLNLSRDTDDDPGSVTTNRARLVAALGLPEMPRWLAQEHGTRVLDANRALDRPAADAATARQPQQVCAVLTADCVPVLFCDPAGRQVAAAHAGWRGLAKGILEATLASFDAPPARLMVWLGPGIGPAAFEVGPEVRDAFCRQDPGTRACFYPSAGNRLLGDLYLLATRRLSRAGVRQIYGGGFCTFEDAARFYSHRRDGAKSGRMATLIWITH